MKLILPLLFFSISLFAQSSDTINGKEMILLSPQEAQIIEYWGKKGIASVPLMTTLDLQIKSLEQQIKFQDFIIENHKNAHSQYREMVERLNKSNSDLSVRLFESERERDIFKDRARQRGYALALIATAAGILGYIGLQ